MTDADKWLLERLYDMACSSPNPECSVPYRAMKRIEELEAKLAVLEKPLYGSFNRGRLQGLDEAAESCRKTGMAVNGKNPDCDIYTSFPATETEGMSHPGMGYAALIEELKNPGDGEQSHSN